jgi:hypothetical protein
MGYPSLVRRVIERCQHITATDTDADAGIGESVAERARGAACLTCSRRSGRIGAEIR